MCLSCILGFDDIQVAITKAQDRNKCQPSARMRSEDYGTWSVCLSVSVRSGTTGIKQAYERY